MMGRGAFAFSTLVVIGVLMATFMVNPLEGVRSTGAFLELGQREVDDPR